jgi:ribosome biogenesis GTPase
LTEPNKKSVLTGKIISLTGGLYTVVTDTGNIPCRARGLFRHENIKPLVGDNVEITPEERDGEGSITAVMPRKNALIRPPLANLDLLLTVIAAAEPEPSQLIADKLITIAEFNKIEPVIVVTKTDLSPETAQHIASDYRKCGFEVFAVNGKSGEGTAELRGFIASVCNGKTAAFAGVSGTGKSTLLNTMFPTLSQVTGELSRRISRGKNTTRRAELFPIADLLCDSSADGYFADTPGFSLLDFEHFDFYDRGDLPFTFREFKPYLAACRYTKCSHTKEDGCAVIAAVREGIIPQGRHDSYVSIYADLKNKRDWD